MKFETKGAMRKAIINTDEWKEIHMLCDFPDMKVPIFVKFFWVDGDTHITSHTTGYLLEHKNEKMKFPEVEQSDNEPLKEITSYEKTMK